MSRLLSEQLRDAKASIIHYDEQAFKEYAEKSCLLPSARSYGT